MWRDSALLRRDLALMRRNSVPICVEVPRRSYCPFFFRPANTTIATIAQ